VAESGNEVSKQTLFICITASLLAGFLLGIFYSDRTPQTGRQTVQQSMEPSKQEQLLQAIASLELAVKENPNSVEAWTRLGNAYYDTDQEKKAIEAYSRSLAIVPGNPSVLTDLGVMYRHSGQPDKAVETFNQALVVSPGFEQALYNKGIVMYYDLGKIGEALKAWKELLLINPDARGPDGTPVSDMVDKSAAFQEKK